jgi:hypothetical protein
MRRVVNAACWAALMLVMIYPYKHLGIFDFSSNELQAGLFGASMVVWAFLSTRRKGFDVGGLRRIILGKIRIGGGVLLLVAAGSEILQAYLPDRDSKLRDFELNGVTIVIVGLLCYGIALTIFSHVRTGEDEHAEIYGFRPPKL